MATGGMPRRMSQSACGKWGARPDTRPNEWWGSSETGSCLHRGLADFRSASLSQKPAIGRPVVWSGCGGPRACLRANGAQWRAKESAHWGGPLKGPSPRALAERAFGFSFFFESSQREPPCNSTRCHSDIREGAGLYDSIFPPEPDCCGARGGAHLFTFFTHEGHTNENAGACSTAGSDDTPTHSGWNH